MRNESTQVDEMVVPEAACLVPLALIAVETGETVDHLVLHFGEAVEVDNIGMRAVPAKLRAAAKTAGLTAYGA